MDLMTARQHAESLARRCFHLRSREAADAIQEALAEAARQARAEALEEAAKVAEDHDGGAEGFRQVAAAIRERSKG
jgi:hypothetical protein